MTVYKTEQQVLRDLSVEVEKETGFDSIPTIERVYDRGESGAFRCVFPDCSVVRHDAVAMWKHVHLSHKHGITKTVAEAIVKAGIK